MAYRRRSYSRRASRRSYSTRGRARSGRRSGGTQRIVIQVAQPPAAVPTIPAGFKAVPLKKATL